ncbi:MAG: hypothetical protein ACI4U3_04455 [Traorella sp.]
MMKIDSFFDTYEKRIHFIYLIFLFTCLTFSIFHILLGLKLIQINNYEEVLNLVHDNIVNESFFGRNAIQLLNIQVFNGISYIIQLISSLKIYEIIYFIGIILSCFTSKKKTGILQLFFLVLTFLFIIIVFLLAFQASSLYHVISYLKMISIELILIYGFSFLFIFIELIHTIKGYQKALEYHIEIVE